MRCVKIAVFDFDGTLYHRRPNGTYSFNQQDLEAISAWRDNGNLAVAATGRSRSALTFAMPPEDALVFDYRVLSNGASATTGDGADLIYAYPIDTDILRAAVEEFGDTEGVAIFGTTVGPVDGAFSINTKTGDLFTDHFARMELADIPDHTFAVVPIRVTDPALRRHVASWADQFPQVTVAQNLDYVDIMANGRNKGTGVLELLEHLGIKREDVEIYTFGDSWNDLDMHAIADQSFSFTHSPADVKEATDHVIEAVADVLSDLA